MTGTTKKFNSQEEGLLNFPGPLMRKGLTLMENVLTSNATSQKKIYESGMTHW